MNKWIKIIFGLIILIVCILLFFPNMFLESWGKNALVLIKGGIVWFLILLGILFIFLGILDLKDN
ncbi:MAG: hypothetical protein ACOC3Z_01235 [Nanoarchaeota archaeon]